MRKFKIKKAYNTQGRRKYAVLIYFYFIQLIKASALLFVGYIPISMVRSTISSLALGTSLDTKSVLVIQQSLELYSILSGILMAMAIYAIIFKLNWSYAKARSEKDQRKQLMSQYFNAENAKYRKPLGFKNAKEVFDENKTTTISEMKKELNDRRHKKETEKQKALHPNHRKNNKKK